MRYQTFPKKFTRGGQPKRKCMAKGVDRFSDTQTFGDNVARCQNCRWELIACKCNQKVFAVQRHCGRRQQHQQKQNVQAKHLHCGNGRAGGVGGYPRANDHEAWKRWAVDQMASASAQMAPASTLSGQVSPKGGSQGGAGKKKKGKKKGKKIARRHKKPAYHKSAYHLAMGF